MSSEQLTRIETKVDGITAQTAELTTQLAVNTYVLDEHHKRTTLLEERMLPVEQHVSFLSKLGKFMLWISAMAGLTLTIVKLIG